MNYIHTTQRQKEKKKGSNAITKEQRPFLSLFSLYQTIWTTSNLFSFRSFKTVPKLEDNLIIVTIIREPISLSFALLLTANTDPHESQPSHCLCLVYVKTFGLVSMTWHLYIYKLRGKGQMVFTWPTLTRNNIIKWVLIRLDCICMQCVRDVSSCLSFAVQFLFWFGSSSMAFSCRCE